MTDETNTLDQRLAVHIRQLRTARALSLEALEQASGVSRSMISLIERGESNPTAVVLDKIAAALGITLASLFAETADDKTGPLNRRDQQEEWRDPASGYRRRNLSPASVGLDVQLVEVLFPAKKTVTFDHHHRQVKVQEQIWLLEGTMQISLGSHSYRLEAGDCLAFRLEQPITFHNPGRKTARYLVARA